MTQDPGGSGPEPTFADVMNGFSLDSKRKPKKRRWGRDRQEDEQPEAPVDRPPAAPAPAPPPAPVEMTGPYGRGTNPQGYRPVPAEPEIVPPPPPPPPPGAPAPAPPAEGGASFVRPYAWTRGRTKSGYELAIETLVSVSNRALSQLEQLPMEHRSVADLLVEQTRSVAEVAALLSLPLGVARVLLGDMASSGTVTVHQTASTPGNVPDLALMERVLSGLRRL
ncbi:DUF742 domain-containing protein [Pseudonocardia sp. HH130630-07]|uniref:DUF742 domain-containing protein n=1 Tax=Pseudonocardia sp. HH130630-07 TaxID=1690815 RepID=UPI000814E2E2|nr:DUF742 domain-containing protein [Pseudonocardia sp. HH130630-07]ANY07136.1 hypothetical protein AFB00_13555 [Pseudonocardia sp. HH130630-07]